MSAPRITPSASKVPGRLYTAAGRPRLLLVGVGRFGEQHLQAWLRLAAEGRVELAGLVVASREHADALAARTGLPVHAGFEAALLGGVDAVDLVTPTPGHAALVAQCLPRAHVLVEKPLALDAATAAKLFRLARRHGRQLVVGHLYHHHPVTKLLLAHLARVQDGPAQLSVRFTNPPDAHSDGLDPLFEWIHVFDLLQATLPSAVTAAGAWLNGRVVQASVATRDGSRAVLRMGWEGVERIRHLQLGWSEVHLDADYLDHSVIITRRDSTEKHWTDPAPTALYQQLGHFLDVVGGHAQPVPSASQVRSVIALAERTAVTATRPAWRSGRPRSDRPRVAVIGGGVFGASCAVELARACDVTLYERHPEVLTEASALNQWRHHSGFHYPRSLDTIREVRESKAEFEAEYEEAIERRLDAYYAVSAWGSEIGTERYLAVCQAHGLSFTSVPPPPDIVHPDRIALCLLTDEAVVEIGKLSRLLMKRLRGHRHIDLQLGTGVRGGKLLADGRKQLRLTQGDEPAPFDFVVNATYANQNRIAGWFGFPVRPLRFDYLELAVLSIPKARRFMMTILDGPFTSLTSMCRDDLFMLSHVHQSILASRAPADGLPPAWGPLASNADNLIRHSLRYLPVLNSASYIESRRCVRTVRAFSEDFDGRPSVVTPHGFGCWSLLGGKIVTAVTNAKEVARAIERESAGR